jgi:hydroxymethylpyrimidine kinase/phosphomethylpyrimidine kinase
VSTRFVLAVGGLDPSGGAGIVADARSIAAMGALPLVVATALTVQAGRGVRDSTPVAPERVAAQIDELLHELPVAAVKIGQVPTATVARTIAARIAKLRVPVVLDPVLLASGGGVLAGDAARRAIAKHLFSLSTLVTVNLDEAEALTGRRVRDVTSMRAAADALRESGAHAVLVKGGHLHAGSAGGGYAVDVLASERRTIELRAKRLRGSMHGTGCALASAAAARLALGDDVETAVRAARAHVRALLRTAVAIRGIRLRPAR